MFSIWLCSMVNLMADFLITHHGLILEKYLKVRYTLNSYLLSTEFCTNLICFNSYQINQLINGNASIYVSSRTSFNWNPYVHYCSQTNYMHELSDIDSLSEKLVNLAFNYARNSYDSIFLLTYPD